MDAWKIKEKNDQIQIKKGYKVSIICKNSKIML